MFGGEILSGAGEGEWLIPYRSRLEEVRLGLIEDQLAARLDLGASPAVIGELGALVNAHPLREGLWALLMVGLYRDGRQAEALATFKRIRTRLSEELGLDPGPQLQQIEQQILSHDPSLGVPSSTGRGLGPEAPVGNLPSMSVELVGREAELAAVTDLLANARLVEIVGPGGVGKTAVAIATGRRMSASDGVAGADVWLARLETAVTADDVIDTLVAALNVRRRGGAVRASQAQQRIGHPRQLRARRRRCRGSRRSPPRRRSRRRGSCARARSRSTSTVRSCSSSHRSRSPTPSSCSRVEPAPNARRGRPVATMTPCTSCAVHSTACRWRSSSPPPEPRRCRSRRSPAVSTIASTC